MKRIFLACLVAMSMFGLYAATETVNGIQWTFRINSGKAEIYNDRWSPAIPKSTTGVITVPSELGGHPVTSIGKYAFYKCSGLTSVTIPDGVTSIGEYAFEGCSSLESMTILGSVKSIGEYAFYGCDSLERVHISDIAAWCSISFGDWSANPLRISGKTDLYLDDELIVSLEIPDGVTSIREYAFCYCRSIVSVMIPSSVKSIGEYAFYGCDSIERVHISDIAAWCNISFDSHPFGENSGKSGELYLGDELIVSLEIPNGVLRVPDCAFYGCRSLARVTMSDSVTSIGEYAFYGCSGLTSVTIPNSVTNIEDYAFYGCSGLTGVTIPDSVTSIGKYAFYKCSGLKSVTIPNGVTGIGDRAFSGCSSLTNIAIPNSITSIANGVFENCSSLTNVVIPNAVTIIGNSAFSFCKSLESVTIPDSVTSIGWNAFYYCSSLANVTIPVSVKSIGDYAFGYCGSLVCVTIPDSVTNIGDYVFYCCYLLESITIPASVTKIGSDAFKSSGLRNMTIHSRFKGRFENKIRNCRIVYFSTVKFVLNGADFSELHITNGLTIAVFPDVEAPMGYSFGGWFTAEDGGELVTASTVVSGDMTLYPRWIPNKYSVSFDGNGGQVVFGEGGTGEDGEKFEVDYECAYGELPNAVKDGYSFVWTLEGLPIDSDSIVNTASNHTLVAIWTPNEYSLSFDAAGGIAGTSSKTVTYDSVYGELPEPSCEGYVFTGWKLNGVAVDATEIVKTASDHTFVATWGVQIGNGIWPVTIDNGAIVLGSPLVAPTGDVTIPAEIAGRPVAGITADAFEGNSSLASLTIPASVADIASGALGDVPVTVIVEEDGQHIPDTIRANVRKAVFADGVTAISDDFFAGCTNLATIDIAESVVAIGKNVFEACSSLATVVTNGCRMYQGWVLDYEGNAAEVTVPDGVLGIAAFAFEKKTAMRSVSLPQSLRFIGAEAFSGCVLLENLILPDAVAAIDDGAFRNCTWVQSVQMPSALKSIGTAAFANCAYLPSIDCAAGLAEIGAEAFSNCWRMTSVSLPASLDSVGEDAFWNCKSLEGVTVPAHVQPLSEMFPAAYASLSSIIIAEGETELCDGVFAGCAGVREIKLPSAVQDIPARAFKDCTGLVRLALPTGLLTIGAEAFSGCCGIASLHLPESLLAIGTKAFFGWTLLEVATIPDGVEEIGAGAFAGCTAVRQVRMPCDVATVRATFPDAYECIAHVAVPADATAIMEGFLSGCAAVTEFDIPETVTEIGAEAFKGCGALAGVTLPGGLVSVGAAAFEGCDALADISIPPSVAQLGAGAFGGCTKLRSVTVPGDAGKLSEIFPAAFRSIVSVTVADGSTSLAEGIFAGCSSLSSVEIPTSVTEIGAGAFENCTSLASVGIPSGVTTLGTGAFRGCTVLAAVALPGGLRVLEDEVFAGCELLAAITVPESVTEFGSRVFDGCDALASVKFVGNAPTVVSDSYEGVPSSLKTYVPNGSTGWDGIDMSQALPEFWPYGTSNGIAWWNPTRLTVTFDWNDGSGTSADLAQVVDTTYILPDADPVHPGAVFSGWWTSETDGARVTPVSRVMRTVTHTLYAHWTMNEYSVAFDANGGIGSMGGLAMTVDEAKPLPGCPFVRVDHDFAGWATEPEGAVVYADGVDVENLTLEDGAVVTLYAVWMPRKWTAEDCLNSSDLVFVNGGDAAWQADAEVSHDGVASFRSGEIGASLEYPERTSSVLKTTVIGSGSGSFWWKVNCEEMDAEYGDWYDYVVFAIDGKEVAKIAGDSGWQKIEYTVSGAGEHELVWTFTRDDYDEDGAEWINAAWVDEFSWNPNPVTVAFAAGGATGTVPEAVVKYAGYSMVLPDAGSLENGAAIFKGWYDGEIMYQPGETYVFGSADVILTAFWEVKMWSFGEAVDAASLAFETGGDSSWSVDTSTGYANGVSAKSGAVTSGQETWIQTTVSGPGTFEFSWNIQGGIYRNSPFAYAKVELDDVVIAEEHKTDGWKTQTFEVVGSGPHTIRWTYLRTSSRNAEGDCAWVDAVTWTPAPSTDITVDVGGGKSVVVPVEWIDSYADIVAAAGGDKAAALQRTAANGRKVWECYVAGIDPTDVTAKFVTKIEMVDGKPVITWEPDMNDGAGKIGVRTYKILGSTDLKTWAEVADEREANFNFFKVEVSMP